MTSLLSLPGEEELQHSLQELLRGFSGDSASHPCVSKRTVPATGLRLLTSQNSEKQGNCRVRATLIQTLPRAMGCTTH